MNSSSQNRVIQNGQLMYENMVDFAHNERHEFVYFTKFKYVLSAKRHWE